MESCRIALRAIIIPRAQGRKRRRRRHFLHKPWVAGIIPAKRGGTMESCRIALCAIIIPCAQGRKRRRRRHFLHKPWFGCIIIPRKKGQSQSFALFDQLFVDMRDHPGLVRNAKSILEGPLFYRLLFQHSIFSALLHPGFRPEQWPRRLHSAENVFPVEKKRLFC